MKEFENSKIKDICYHGTDSAAFTTLDFSKIHKDPEEGDSGYFGWGFYLTTDKEYAEQYGDTVLAFKVNIENPFDFTLDSYDDLVDFLFADCDNLDTRLEETLYVLNNIGRDKFEICEVDNSEELKQRCLELYNRCFDKKFSSEDIVEMKVILSELAEDVGNWLNGLFFYFGKELFHYFTMNGYDGVIAQGGKEVVVYETKQLQALDDKVQEELDLDVLQIPDWEAGSSEYMGKIEDTLKNYPGVTHYEFHTKLYPSRKASVWYYDKGLLTIKWKDLLEIYFYCGGEIEVYRDEDDDNPIVSVRDLEEEGIFDDDGYYSYMNENDRWDLSNNNSTYFGFIFTPLKHNDIQMDFYHYDEGYDDYYDLDDLFPIDWLFTDGIPDFIEAHPEYFEGEETFTDEERINILRNKIPLPLRNYTPEEMLNAINTATVPSTVRRDMITYLSAIGKMPVNEAKEEKPAVKKHITKEQVLKDVIKTFGTIEKDKLTDAIFILPNGKILDTKGSNDKSQHINVAKYISDKYNYNDLANDSSKFMDSIGAIRFTPWIPAMVISDVPLTEKQTDTLFDVLTALANKVTEESPLMISTVDGKQQIEYTHIANPEEIINSLLGYQIFGLLKEKLDTKGAEMKFLRRING